MFLTPQERELLIEGIYAGFYNLEAPPKWLYIKTADHLKSGAYKGYAKLFEQAEVDSKDYYTLINFQNNINIFSAAKTWQQSKDMASLMFDNDVLKPFKDFREAAGRISDIYNEEWIKTEWDLAVKQGMAARKWNTAERQKETLTMLRYQTVNDALVRPEHAILDGITKPVDDPFWNNFYPPNGYNCRCIVIQLKEAKETEIDKEYMEQIKENIPPLFRMNPGKDQYIFKVEGKNAHPYLSVSEKYQILKENNFNLPRSY